MFAMAYIPSTKDSPIGISHKHLDLGTLVATYSYSKIWLKNDYSCNFETDLLCEMLLNFAKN